MSESDWKLDFSYLRPPQEAQEIIHDEHYIKHNQGVKGTRKIYEFVTYDTFENNGIQEIEMECKKLNIKLPMDWKRSDYLKMQYCGRFKVKEAIKKLQTHLEWNLEDLSINFLVLNEKFNIFFNKKKKGIVYIHGRDKQYRPIVILNAHLIDLKNDSKEIIIHALSFLLRIVKQQMMIPGKVENWIFILETNKVGVFDLPLKALGIIIECMSVNFCGCLDKMYLLNPSGGLQFMWNAISAFIDPETKEKINFINQKTMDRIKERVNVEQLEMKYGGTRQNLTKFWPPINIDLPNGYPDFNQKQENQVFSPQQKSSISPVIDIEQKPLQDEEYKNCDNQQKVQQSLQQEEQLYPQETPKIVVDRLIANCSETKIEQVQPGSNIQIDQMPIEQSQQVNTVEMGNNLNMDILESQKIQEVASFRNVSNSQGNGTSAYVTFGKVSRSFVEQPQNTHQCGEQVQQQSSFQMDQQQELMKFQQEEQNVEFIDQQTPSEVRGRLSLIEGEQASIKPGCCGSNKDCRIF